MVTKKKSAKKMIAVCTACHSIHLKIQDSLYICQRCQHTMKKPLQKSLAAVKADHNKRTSRLKKTHYIKKAAHHYKFHDFIGRFHLRMWFKIISTIILACGIVLMTSTEVWSGVLFTVIGIIGLHTGMRL